MSWSALLETIAADLDIPTELAEEAVVEYESVAAWLGAEDSALYTHSPDIYPQGSFRLGTPVRPLRGDDFDIDLVCKLDLEKEQTTQRDLKNLVGDRLRKSPELADRLEPKRRCWTLTYGRKFHLDVLPSIPDQEATSNSILLTDRELTRWQHGNPIGYADWFFSRMGPQLLEEERRLAAESKVDIAEVPRWRIRTPLQRCVQLLKRHRDVTFKDDPDNCPVSIIVTTLAAQAFRGEHDLSVALLDMARRMPALIENRNGRWWVANPAHPGENFADKWNEVPERREKFLAWLARFEDDVRNLRGLLTESAAQTRLGQVFNVGPTNLATAGAVVPALASESHVQAAPWPQRLTYRCDTKGLVYPKIHGRKSLWPLTDRAVPKHLGLRFEAKTNTPLPYQVKWQVTNTGQEALVAGQLRGRFEEGEAHTGSAHWESTLYAGTHWVEASVIKDGVCVAKSGRRLVRVRS